MKQGKELHVEMRGDRKFELVWTEGSTVVNTIDVPCRKGPVGSSGDYTSPDLAKAISREWKKNGNHRAATDKKLDQAVLHTESTTPFSDVIAVIDAIYTPQREFDFAGKSQKVPAFNVTFAAN